MNFGAISRFHFQAIEKSMHSYRSAETLRLGKSMVTMTNGLFQRMGEPEYLFFGYDPEEKALGIKVTTKDDPNALKVKRNSTYSTRVQNSTYISHKIAEVLNADLEEKSILMKRGYKADEYYVFELRYAEVLKKSGRKKNAI